MSAKKPKAAKKVLGKDALKRVKGGGISLVEVSNNKQKSSQKAADANDQYIRS